MSNLPFTIPKKKRALDNSSDLSGDDVRFIDTAPNSSTFKEIESVVFKCLSETRLRSALSLQNVRKVINKKLERKFLNHKSKIKANGYSDLESWGFLHAPVATQQVDDILRNGYHTNSSYFSELGKAEHGVYLSTNPDLVTPALFYKDIPLRIVLFKTVKGRQKKISLGAKNVLSPDFNCLVSDSAPGRSNRSNRYVKFRNSLVFYYELNGNGISEQIPSGTWPYAVFDLILSSSFKSLPCHRYHISGYSGCEEVCKSTWNNGIFKEKFELSSICDNLYAVRPVLLNDFKIKQFCFWKDALTHPAFKMLLENKYWGHVLLTKEISIQLDDNDCWFAAHYLYKSTNIDFVKKVENMVEKRLCAVGYAESSYLVFLIPQGELSSRMGFPYYSTDNLLHAVFLRKNLSLVGSKDDMYKAWQNEKELSQANIENAVLVDGNTEVFIKHCHEFAASYSIRLRNAMQTLPSSVGPIRAPSRVETPAFKPYVIPAGVKSILSKKDEEAARKGKNKGSLIQIEKPVKRRIRWADYCGLPLSNISQFDKERSADQISVKALLKKELEHDKQTLSQPPSSANGVNSPSASNEPPQKINSIFQDALSSLHSQNGAIAPTELTPFQLPSTSKENIVPVEPMDACSTREAASVGTPQDEDMDIESDSEENRSFSPVTDKDVVDPNDIDYDSRFNIAIVDPEPDPEPIKEIEEKLDESESKESSESSDPSIVELPQHQEEESQVDELLRNILGGAKKDNNQRDSEIQSNDTMELNNSVSSLLESLANSVPPTIGEEPTQVTTSTPIDLSKRKSRFDVPPVPVAVSPANPAVADVDIRPKVQTNINQPKFNGADRNPLPPESSTLRRTPIGGGAAEARQRMMALLMNKQRNKLVDDNNHVVAHSQPSPPMPAVSYFPGNTVTQTLHKYSNSGIHNQFSKYGYKNKIGAPASSRFSKDIPHTSYSSSYTECPPPASPEPDLCAGDNRASGSYTLPSPASPDFGPASPDQAASPLAEESSTISTRAIPLSEKSNSVSPDIIDEEEDGEIVSEDEGDQPINIPSSQINMETTEKPMPTSFSTSPSPLRSVGSPVVSSKSNRYWSSIPTSPNRSWGSPVQNSAEWANIIIPDILSFDPHCLNPEDLRSFCAKLELSNAHKDNEYKKNFIHLHVHCYKQLDHKRKSVVDENNRNAYNGYFEVLKEFERNGLVRVMVEHDCDVNHVRTQKEISECLKLSMFNCRKHHPKTRLIYMSNQHPSSSLGQSLFKMGIQIVSPQTLFSGFPDALTSPHV